MRAVRIGLPTAVLFVVASVAAAAVPLARGSVSAGARDERPAAAVERFGCAQVASSIDDYCDRIAEDLGRRTSRAAGALPALGLHPGGGPVGAGRLRFRRSSGTVGRLPDDACLSP